MFRRIAPFLLPLGLLIPALTAPPAVLAGDPCFHSTDRPSPTTGATTAIGIGDCVFLPTVTSVPVGATVEWTNRSFQAHEVVGANLTWGAHDKLLQPGDSIGWKFDKPGVYAYSCMLHPGMSGAIVVGDIAAATGAGALAATGAAPNDTTTSTSAAAEPGPPVAIVAGGAGAVLVGAIAVGFLLRRRQVAT
jgi:plastocyanin